MGAVQRSGALCSLAVHLAGEILHPLHLALLHEAVDKGPLLVGFVHEGDPQHVVQALVEGLRLRVVVQLVALEEVKPVDVDGHIRIGAVPHEPVDGQATACGVLPFADVELLLQPVDVGRGGPAHGGAADDAPGSAPGQVHGGAEHEVGEGDHEAVHEEGEADAGARHLVLRERGVEHAVREVHGRFGSGPRLKAGRLRLEIVEADDLIHGVDELAVRSPLRQARAVAEDGDLAALELRLLGAEQPVRALLPRQNPRDAEQAERGPEARNVDRPEEEEVREAPGGEAQQHRGDAGVEDAGQRQPHAEHRAPVELRLLRGGGGKVQADKRDADGVGQRRAGAVRCHDPRPEALAAVRPRLRGLGIHGRRLADGLLRGLGHGGLDLVARVAVGHGVLQPLHLPLLDQGVDEGPLLRRLVHHVHPQQVVEVLVERLRLRVVVHGRTLEKVKTVDVDGHLRVGPVPHEPIDGEEAARGMLP
mmetsp:Transcript_132554/g.412132  ORF Transcript_132554/g.412132 Transcript_132554/m.412132 type:complete len:477 (-) Transcript_132554:855-2285(-)